MAGKAQVLAATLRAKVREKCASEMTWMTADRMRWGQPLGRGMLSTRSERSIKASRKKSGTVSQGG
jgi:hypothetical protein